jgi:hypothetical protein
MMSQRIHPESLVVSSFLFLPVRVIVSEWNEDPKDRELGILFWILVVTGSFFGFLPGFCGVLHGFLSHSGYACYKFFLGVQTLRGPQE